MSAVGLSACAYIRTDMILAASFWVQFDPRRPQSSEVTVAKQQINPMRQTLRDTMFNFPVLMEVPARPTCSNPASLKRPSGPHGAARPWDSRAFISMWWTFRVAVIQEVIDHISYPIEAVRCKIPEEYGTYPGVHIKPRPSDLKDHFRRTCADRSALCLQITWTWL
ncbi:hypothetical protein F2P79_018311 [Pimephales promelas]|nr:hypothetical protein F2P79_018311 [Pimephales promelas]